MRARFSILVIWLALVFLVIGCATLPEDFDKPASYALTDTGDTLFGRGVSKQAKEHPGKSGFFLLGNGLDAFVARAVLSHYAERSIDVQYYLFHNDLVGKLLVDQLLKAADRGVRVRLLVDDMDMGGRDLGASVADAHPNMEVRFFNPFSRNVGRTSQFLTRYGSVTRRMHNKSFTVDNQVSILGGRNIGNEYFEAHPDLAFADLDVMVIGQEVKEVSASFDRYWNSELAYPVTALRGKPPTVQEIQQKRQALDDFVSEQQDTEYMQALRNSNLANRIRARKMQYRWGEAQIVFDQPEKLLHSFDQTQYHLAPQLKPFFQGVQRELIIFSPYFVPGKEGTAALSELSQRGVRVRIITNSLSSNDVGIVHAGYSKYRKDLLRAGVELYEMNKKLSRKERKEKKGVGGSSKASLHAKSFIFDREKVFIGSLNLDPRAVLHNTEIGVVFEQAEIAEEMGKWFDENMPKIAFRLELVKNKNGSTGIRWHGVVDGEQTTLSVEPYTGFWQRFGIGFFSMFPIDSQL